jgi:hypothetical protein
MGKNNETNRILSIGLGSQAVALVLGMALHSSAILAGRTLFYGKIFTPALDLVFVPFITLGGVLGVWGHLAAGKESRGLRIAGLLVSAYFLISIPLHAKTLVTWSTAHFAAFPERYSMFIIPVQLLFLLIVSACLRKKGNKPQPLAAGRDRQDFLSNLADRRLGSGV